MGEQPYISRKDQAKLTKKKIFDTTMLLIKKKGYSKITIREICQHTQLSVGTFYLYFSSKDEILLEIYHKIDAHIPPAAYSASENLSDYVVEQFSLFFHVIINAFDKELLQEIYRISLSGNHNEFLSPERPLYHNVLEALTTYQDTGIFLVSDSPDILCRNIHIFVQGHIFHWLSDNNLDASFLIKECALALGNYLSLFMSNV